MEALTAIQGRILRKPKNRVFIKKIKIKDDWELIEIIYELPEDFGALKTVNFKCKESPSPFLIDAFQGLFKHIAQISQLNWESGRIQAIAFKEEEEGLMVSIVSAMELLDFRCTNSIDYFYPTSELLYKLLDAISWAEDYIDGAREQQSLDLAVPATAPF